MTQCLFNWCFYIELFINFKLITRFVDIIHTDQELGLEKAIGNVDFYPNNGRDQPSKYLR